MTSVLQPLLQDVGVDLGGGDVGMAEQLLHDAQIGAVLQQVAGEGVAHAHAARSSPPAIPVRAARSLRSRAKACRVRWPLSPKEGNSQGLSATPESRPRREIGRHRVARLVGQRHDALVPALAAHREHALVAGA